MLKRLELIGFKSFADKTVFEFGAGMTCFVGPNGSGKSNVVDAIKWILGEQSAKSLRGREMADVIFNGSGTRRSLGFAEATLVFDNSQRRLPLDTDEVQITRRVYRSGEGEYQINRSPSRLRDIRDLFMGTGAATPAYCIIEQGKVDLLLQASAKERRGLFEEVAGISRFLARKQEASRKLERVEQNLLRVSDVVEEVEKRLRSVKLQAAKARRYREHADRLRELRVRVAQADYHALSRQIGQLEQQMAELEGQVADQASRADAAAAKLVQVESLNDELDERLRDVEAAVTERRQQIARLDSQIGYERAHSRDLQAQASRLRHQAVQFAKGVAELEGQLRRIEAEVSQVEQEHEQGRQAVQAEQQALEQLRGRVDEQRRQLDQARSELMTAAQSATRLGNELTVLEAQSQTLAAQRQRLQGRLETAREPVERLSGQVRELGRQRDRLQNQRGELTRALESLAGQLDADRQALEQTAAALAQARERRSAVLGRRDLLQDLEDRREGLGSGVQAALQDPLLQPLCLGLVADLLEVDLEHADLIERALGQRTQYVVVRSRAELLEIIDQQAPDWPGPVTFLALDCLPAGQLVTTGPHSAIDDQQADPFARRDSDPRHLPGSLTRACELVRVPEHLRPLVEYLLAQTAVVDDLGAAISMADRLGAGWRLVTADGHVLDCAGAITVGRPAAQAGLVSRKSLLRSLQQELDQIDATIAELEQRRQEQEGELNRRQAEADTLKGQSEQLARQLAETQTELERARQQYQLMREEVEADSRELAAVEQELADQERRRRSIQDELAGHQARADAMEAQVAEHECWIAQQLEQIEHRAAQLTAARLELARTEGHLTGLRQRMAAVADDLHQRQRVRLQTQQQIQSLAEQDRQCRRAILAAASQAALLYRDKEQLSRQITTLLDQRDRLRRQRQQLKSENQAIQNQLQELQQRLHQQQLQCSQLRHQRDTLVERMQEDYELDLPQMHRGYDPTQPLDRDSVEQQIAELRRKINNLGQVNLQALEELDELETRRATLHAQLDDLNQSKARLDQIIAKINRDSERMFLQTLEAVRGHFGVLFRKLFGGGRADILLDDESNVLESGIEIVARPPGKQLRSISLLSGGEKTLTAVALLLAVFQSKPGPFCVLDEVDAALDESNIDRFTAVLREFLDRTQFILITHSKKTMVFADVLYGITMQESGVSKRVSVRLQDVNEQGEIVASEGSAEASGDQEAA